VVTASFCAGCSGGGGSGTTPQPIASSAQADLVPVTFTIKWPAASSSATRSRGLRGSKYLPSTARSASIGLYGGTPQYLNSPTSTLTFTAPAGLDTFLVQVYDEQNGDGNVLSKANITQKISGTSGNIVATTLNGVIASLKVTLSNPAPAAGTKATITVTAAGLDADGNTIIGPADYSTPITLGISDPAGSGTLSLSKTLLQTPATAVTLTYSGGTLWSAAVTASAGGVAAFSAPLTPTPTIYSIKLPNSASRPVYVTPGPSGLMWFTDNGTNAIGRSSLTGTVSETTIPDANAQPGGIVEASDGNIYFSEANGMHVGKSSPSGVVSEPFDIVAVSSGIVSDGNGHLWVLQPGDDFQSSSFILNLNLASKTFNSYGIPTSNAFPLSLAFGPDANLYFTEFGANQIGKVYDPYQSTTISELPVPTDSSPRSIVRGPDGNMWFTELNRSRIAVLSWYSDSLTAEYITPTINSGPNLMTVGNDGALWFTEDYVNRIGRITTGGVITEYPVGPMSSSLQLQGIATAPDGSIWFCETAKNVIGRLVY
jgi:streptogramin lyase